MFSEGWSNILNKQLKYYFQIKPGTSVTMEENRKQGNRIQERTQKTGEETKIFIQIVNMYITSLNSN